MIFDSSVWIDFFQGKKTVHTNLLDELLERYDETDVHICPAILQEVLQGLRSRENYDLLQELMFSSQFLYLDPYFVAENAAGIYRSLRTKGITILKPNDCQIAFYAIHFKLKLVHTDKDFDKIAKHTSLKIYST
jgi:predicted nucleic acid-binding protein